MAHRTRSDLLAAVPDIQAAPPAGPVEMIVLRPVSGQRAVVDRVEMSAARGLHGDRWENHCWVHTETGDPHPGVQVCLMPVRAIRAIAGDRENWAASGNNLFVDMDLTPDRCPPGTRLALGGAEIEIGDIPARGCAKFVGWYGRDACAFVNVGIGWRMRLRGLYARVVRDGTVSVGDQVRVVETAGGRTAQVEG